MLEKSVEESRKDIVEKIKEHRVISTSELSVATGINADTLRYHLEEMQKDHLVMNGDKASGRTRRHYWRICRVREYTELLKRKFI